MTSILFNKRYTQPEKENPTQDAYWTREIEETMKLGYSYEVAYAMVSKRKIQEFFDKDRKNKQPSSLILWLFI